jgi:hypothetical protein
MIAIFWPFKSDALWGASLNQPLGKCSRDSNLNVG